jgi:AmiR/NasT family two-component response regulator
MVAELQAEGVLSRDHIDQLEAALLSSRVIGAAVGILMGTRQVSQQKAFELLKQASQRQNRKLRDLAAELVDHADHGGLIGGEPLL